MPSTARFVRGVLAVAGIGLGAGIWFVQGAFTGDVFFHLGRIRKLETLHSLSLHNVGRVQARRAPSRLRVPALARLARARGPARGSRSDERGGARGEHPRAARARARLRDGLGDLPLDRPRARRRLRAARVQGLRAGPRRRLSLPLAAGAASRPSCSFPLRSASSSTSCASRAGRPGSCSPRRRRSISLVHPTYALFLAIPLVAYVIARALLTWRLRLPGRRSSRLAVFGLPMALAFLWLLPVVRQTIPVSPGPAQLAKNLHHYRADLVVHSLSRYSLAPARIDRNGAVTIVALLLVPLALLARRRRWSALVLGGTVAVLGDRALADRLPALLQPRLALAVAAPVRVRPLRRGPRRRLRDHQPLLADARARGRAGVRHLAPGRVRRRLRAARAQDGALDRRLDRALRRHRRARRRSSSRVAALPRAAACRARARATASPLWPSSSSSCPSSSTASRRGRRRSSTTGTRSRRD